MKIRFQNYWKPSGRRAECSTLFLLFVKHNNSYGMRFSIEQALKEYKGEELVERFQNVCKKHGVWGMGDTGKVFNVYLLTIGSEIHDMIQFDPYLIAQVLEAIKEGDQFKFGYSRKGGKWESINISNQYLMEYLILSLNTLLFNKCQNAYSQFGIAEAPEKMNSDAEGLAGCFIMPYSEGKDWDTIMKFERERSNLKKKSEGRGKNGYPALGQIVKWYLAPCKELCKGLSIDKIYCFIGDLMFDAGLVSSETDKVKDWEILDNKEKSDLVGSWENSQDTFRKSKRRFFDIFKKEK